MRSFQCLSPTTVELALELLGKFGANAVVLAGGTDVLVWFNERIIKPEYVIDISKLKELRYIQADQDCIRIGPLTTFAALQNSSIIRRSAAALAEAARQSAGPQVRNLATIGGNLGTASPAGDLILALVGLDATIQVRSQKGERTLTMDQLLVGPKKNSLGKDELITQVVVPVAATGSGSAFHKLGNRKAMTISIASSAAAVTLSADGKHFDSVRVALGSVAPTVVRARKFELALHGKPATREEIAKAQPLVAADISPITDIRGKAWYRKEAAGVLAARSVEDAVSCALGEKPSAGQLDKRTGWGVGGTFYSSTVHSGVPNPYSVNLQMREDGSVVIQTGGCDIGQGSNTVIAMMAAEMLGIDVERVTIYSADTGVTPLDFGTVSSRQTYAGGNALLEACAPIKRALFHAAAHKLGIPADRFTLTPGFIRDQDDPQKSVPIAEAARIAHFEIREMPNGSGTWYPKSERPDENGQGKAIACFNYHATVAEVEVDTQLGVVEVKKLYATVDAGKAINPALIEGQVDGGALMAAAWAVREDAQPGLSPVGRATEFDPAFEPKDLANYPIATALDAPEIHSSFVEVPETTGPFGAKAVGEISAMTAAPAILNAIDDAVGIRLFDLPASPEKVLKALQSKCQVARQAAGA